MKRLKLMESGCTIGICAPSATFDKDRFDTGVHVLENLGFNVKIPDQIFLKKRYLAGEDIHRAQVFMQLFTDPQVDAVISARGGFGALRTLEYINWEVIAENPKPFIGFSDATALLVALVDQCKMPVIHGPTLISLATASSETIESLRQILTENHYHQIKLFDQAIFPGKAEGIFKGGNLSTISHLVGTDFQPDFNRCIFFMEEINEPAYKIDRMLTQMKMAGLFDGLAGVVTGSFTDCDNEEYIPQILDDIFQDFNIPVLCGLSSGHGNINRSLMMGTVVEINSQESMIAWKNA